jgi:glycine betaine/proline transport system substrate-binding protein
MQLKTLRRPVILGSALIALMLFIAACGAAATPTPEPTPEPEPTVAATTPAPAMEAETPEPTAAATTPAQAMGAETPEPTAAATTPAPAMEAETPEPAAAEPAAQAMPGEGVEVQPARATWNTGYFNEAVYSLALEELGYDVQDHQELDNPLFYQAVAQGDVDYWANGWFPLHNQYRDVFAQGASIAGTVVEQGALEGYLVDKAGAEEFNITSLEDFKRPEVKQAFDADGNGKADLVACPEGWGCNAVVGFHLDTFGLRDHVDEITAGYSASMADAVARFRNNQHILFYTWTPNWTVNQLMAGEDVVWIEVPAPEYPEEDVSDDALSISGVEGCVDDPCLMGFPANDIQVVANNEFLENNPAAAKLFEVMSIPVEDIYVQNALMNQGENSQTDIDRHAQEWADTHQEMWNSWLEQARQAAQP